ncbi:conserved hypothetical protein [Halobacteriovorax marinus SJ]|uniref:Uncharacterized protein n=1 Tax=Halobacteriovorax marinus (strain ATCC BAA-682 / DSM 15412 / SJ) TaxID=862908 RepID=E1X1G4_HALMS|nr:hypothetical protein [Halobacteriovorax marinus]CBW26555.1 conserved hypothetical protein [Halobacteriovorax marinus SJ]
MSTRKSFLISALILGFCGLGTPLLANEQEAVEYQNYDQVNDQRDQLEKLLEIPEVGQIYEKCNQVKANVDPNLDVSKCIWEGDNANGITGVKDQEGIKEKITSSLSELDDKKNTKYESVNVLPTNKKISNAQKKLEEYYYKSMKEKIFGEGESMKNSDGTFKVIDHSRFNSIYQNQLTNNILTAISSFCIEAKMMGTGENAFPLLSNTQSKRESQRKENIKKLGDKGNGEKSGAQIQSESWQSCFINAQYVCHGGTKTTKNKETGDYDKITAKSVFGYKEDCSSISDTDKKKKCEETKKDYNYSKGRACELTNYLKVARQNLKAVEKIDQGYQEIAKTGGLAVAATGEKLNPNQNLIKNVSTDDKLDEITAVTSNEFVNDSKFSEGVNEDLAELESCIAKDPDTGEYILAPNAQESCKKYLNTNREEVDRIKSEYALRLRGLSEKANLIDKESDDTKGVESFLKDQGYTEDQIGQTIEANTDIKKLKAQIIARYENEKEALIESMNKRMEETASTNNGVIDTSAGSKDIKKLEKIHKELSSKTEQYAQLIHFNNIVAGFLEVGEDQENARRNTASISREVENSAFSEDNLQANPEFANTYINQNENIQKSLEANQVDLSSGSKRAGNTEGAVLGVDKINNVILNYDEESGN